VPLAVWRFIWEIPVINEVSIPFTEKSISQSVNKTIRSEFLNYESVDQSDKEEFSDPQLLTIG